MKTDNVTRHVVLESEAVGVTAPPASFSLPNLSVAQREQAVNALQVLLKQALGISQIQGADPAPAQPPAPKVHKRPKSWFD